MSQSSSFRVLIAGGGVAGLEAVLALRDLARDRVETTLLSPVEDFVYSPMAVGEPFGRGHAAHHPLSDIARDLDVRFVLGALSEVDAEARVAVTGTGDRLPYDALLVAVGARSEPAFRRPLTWTPETDSELFGGLLRDLEEGYVKRVAFIVPPGVAWALPAYELALMTAWQAWGMGQNDVEVMVYTPEEAPLGLFGARASAAVRQELEEAGVHVETGVYVAEDPEVPDRLILHPGERPLEAQRIVALPRAAGLALPGLAADARGFILTDLHGKVPGTDAVWAAGDAIAFPVKQGGLAAQQADAAAEAIAAAAGVQIEPRPYQPVLRGMMLVGRGSEWMRHDPSGGSREEAASRHALWWPPTKIAGRYLSPYLARLDGTPTFDDSSRPHGEAVELDLERDLPATADAMRQARLRSAPDRARFAERRAEAVRGAPKRPPSV